MDIKDKIKKDIDKIPPEKLPELDKYISSIINAKKRRKVNLTPRDFGGKLDHLNARDLAYE